MYLFTYAFDDKNANELYSGEPPVSAKAPTLVGHQYVTTIRIPPREKSFPDLQAEHPLLRLALRDAGPVCLQARLLEVYSMVHLELSEI